MDAGQPALVFLQAGVADRRMWQAQVDVFAPARAAQFWLDGPESAPGRMSGAARALFLQMNGVALRAADPGPSLDEDSAWSRLESLRLPTPVLWGDRDVAHLQSRCELLVQRIPGAPRAVRGGTAHLPGLEAPQAFNRALEGLVAGL